MTEAQTGGDWVLIERHANVAIVTMNRGEKLNPIGAPMRGALVEAIADAEADDSVGCVLLTASGRAFSAGADMAGGPPATSAGEWYRYHGQVESFLNRVRGAAKPVVAAVDGLCYGLGLILAAHCDLILASERARFGLIEARMGSAGVGVFPMLVGPQWAKFLILTGEAISAKRAREIGLVLEVIDDASLRERALDLAQRIASMPRDASYMNKRNVDSAMDIAGWAPVERFTRSHTAVVDADLHLARNARGEVLMDVLRDRGLAEFVKARDEAFPSRWLEW